MRATILIVGLSLSVLAASSSVAAISYISGGAGWDVSVTLASPSFGFVEGINQRHGVGIPPSGSDSIVIDQSDPGTPIAFDGTIELAYDANVGPNGFDLQASVPQFDLPSDVTSFDVSAIVSIRFTVDSVTDAILVGSSPAAGETIWFHDADFTQYFWTEMLNGPPVGTNLITLTPGVEYVAAVWTGFGQQSPNLSLVLIPEPSTAFLLGFGLVGIAQRRPPYPWGGDRQNKLPFRHHR